MVCTLDKHLHESLQVNSCQLLVKAMSACRFQADSIIFLHDEQPHVEYLPTKVPTLPPTPSLLCCSISTPCNFFYHHICAQQHYWQVQQVWCAAFTVENEFNWSAVKAAEEMTAGVRVHVQANILAAVAGNRLPALGFPLLQFLRPWLPAPPPHWGQLG